MADGGGLRRLRRRSALHQPERSDAMLRGVALGLYRFNRQSTNTFRDWARDDPSIVLEEALRRWRGRRGGSAARRPTEEWLSEHLPEWEWVWSES